MARRINLGITLKQLEQIYQNMGKSLPSECGGETAQSKYRNKKKCVDGRIFDSATEAEAYLVLKQWQQSGLVKDIEFQPPFLLQKGFRDSSGKKHRAIKYKADFKVTYSDGSEVIVDVKGFKTEVFRIKHKLLMAIYPDINFQLWDRKTVRDAAKGIRP